MGSWITVDSIVTDYIGESELSLSQYYKLWNIAFRGMEDLGLDFFYEVRTVKIPVNPNGTATLPANINWIKVGYFDFSGSFRPLYYNQKLTNYASLSSNRLAKNNSNGGIINNLDEIYSLGAPCFYNYYGGGCLFGSQWYGGTFNVDEKNGIIIFDDWTQIADVAVEIMCAPKSGEEYYVPSVFREPLIEWIGWRDIKHLPNSRRSNISEKRDRKHDYYNARRIAGMRYKPFNLEQAAMT